MKQEDFCETIKSLVSEMDQIYFIKICFSLPQEHLRNEAISDVLFILQIDKLLPKSMENTCDQFQKQRNTVSSFTNNSFFTGIFQGWYVSSLFPENLVLRKAISQAVV